MLKIIIIIGIIFVIYSVYSASKARKEEKEKYNQKHLAPTLNRLQEKKDLINQIVSEVATASHSKAEGIS